MDMQFIFSAFIAGLLTFLAPCTLPLVPGYLGFISGVSASEIQNMALGKNIRKKIFVNGLFYVLGFSFIFILLGVLFGLGGGQLIQYRVILGRIGGILIVIFGLYMLGMQFSGLEKFLYTLWWFGKEIKLPFFSFLRPGNTFSSFLFGAIFAFGWTPCIGPILGTVLLLASQSATIMSGTILLTVFSIGLAIPFLLLAAGFGHGFYTWRHKEIFFKLVSVVSGLFLIIIGWLLIFDAFSEWVSFFYRVFNFLEYEALLNYL